MIRPMHMAIFTASMRSGKSSNYIYVLTLLLNVKIEASVISGGKKKPRFHILKVEDLVQLSN